MFNNGFDMQRFAMRAIAFLIALTIHEYAHARSALAAGDDTAQRNGRVSLNPLDHLDPVGTLMFIVTSLTGFGIAWGKPVPVNSYNLKSPRWDNLKISLWGPVSNIITATILAMLLRFVIDPLYPKWDYLAFYVFRFNLIIAFFNLIPIPPLDGSHIFSALLPDESARRYDSIMGRYGIMILVALLFTGAVGRLIGPPIVLFGHTLLGNFLWFRMLYGM